MKLIPSNKSYDLAMILSVDSKTLQLGTQEEWMVILIGSVWERDYIYTSELGRPMLVIAVAWHGGKSHT